MARTESNMLALGTQAPDFHLPDTVSGKSLTYADIAGDKATLVMFICNHCPFVKHIVPGLAAYARDYRGRGVGITAISANDISSHPQDAPQHMRTLAESAGFDFPYLYDATQDVARAYQAACTPDFYLFDGNGELAYRGRFDAATHGNGKPVTGNDLRAATDAVLAGRAPAAEQHPSIGCNIKWT